MSLQIDHYCVARADDGPPVRATVRRPAHSRATVVLLHGFKGFASWGFFPWLGESLAGAGFTAVSVDFSMNGIEEIADQFTRLDLFEGNSLLQEVADARAVLDHLQAQQLAAQPIVLLGHSRGGAVALLAAAADSRVAAVVGWAAVADFRARFPADAWAAWTKDGYLDVPNARTGQLMRLGERLRAELEDDTQAVRPTAAAAAFPGPVLLIHGTDDESVPVAEMSVLAAARRDRPTELLLVRGAGHTFGAVHPFQGSTPALRQALTGSVSFVTARANDARREPNRLVTEQDDRS